MEATTNFNQPCPRCGRFEFFYDIRLAGSFPAAKEVGVKFVPMIGKWCVSCDKHIKWITQTSEVIEKINQTIKELRWKDL